MEVEQEDLDLDLNWFVEDEHGGYGVEGCLSVDEEDHEGGGDLGFVVEN